MANIGYRENIETWAANSPRLYQFRRGLEEMQKISDASLMDERGYQWCAGVHGGFGGAPYCEHGTLNFLTWHRPYVLDFEIKIRDQIRKVAGQQAAEDWRLPYWNWASRTTKGIPKVFTDKTYKDGDETKPNPLYSMPYNLNLPPGPPVPDPWPTATFRSAGNLASLKRLRAQVLTALDKPQFAVANGFSRSIEQPHNGLHVWVSGYMLTLRSSFDPIFWCHHANVDRQWWIWQQKFGNSTIPTEQRDFTCQPFSFQDNRAGAFFDTRALGYEYTGASIGIEHEAALAGGVTRVTTSKKKASKKKPAATLSFDVGSFKRDVERAELEIQGLRHTEETLQIRVYANKKAANAKTPQNAGAGFLGTITILGHGNCPGAHGHCDVRTEPQFSGDVRAPHHLAPFDVYLDIATGLRTIAKGTKSAGTGKISLSFVVVDSTGKQRPSSAIKFERVRVVVD